MSSGPELGVVEQLGVYETLILSAQLGRPCMLVRGPDTTSELRKLVVESEENELREILEEDSNTTPKEYPF